MNQKSLKKNAFFSILYSVMGIIYPLITFPYASKVLLPQGIGQYEFANSIISYFLIIANLGIISYGSREMARVRDSKTSRNKLAKELLAINFISTCFAYLLMLIVVFSVKSLSNYRQLLSVLGLRVLFSMLNMEWLYQAFEDYGYIAFRSIVFQILSLIALFIFVKTYNDVIIYAIINIVALLGTSVCNFIHSKKYIDLREKISFNLKVHLRSILIFFGMSVSVSLYTVLDISMIGFLTDDASVGYYTTANRINRLVLTIVSAAVSVLSPRISYLVATEDNDNSWLWLFQKSLSFVICFSIPCIFGLFILSPQLILYLCGEKFIPSIRLMRMLVPVIFVWSLASVIGSTILSPLRKEKYMLYAQITGAVVNVILNFILIRLLGVFGAVVATLIAESCVTGIQMIVARKFVFNKFFLINAFQSFISSCVMAGFVLCIRRITNYTLWGCCLCIVFGMMGYFLFMLLLKNNIAVSIFRKIFNINFSHK